MSFEIEDRRSKTKLVGGGERGGAQIPFLGWNSYESQINSAFHSIAIQYAPDF